MGLSSMYAPAYQFPFAQAACAVYPHDHTSLPLLASALAPSESPMPSMLHAHRESIDNPDAMARIRTQAVFSLLFEFCLPWSPVRGFLSMQVVRVSFSVMIADVMYRSLINIFYNIT